MNSQNKHLRKIASSGGHARILAYGNPGTALGRQRGGLASLLVNRKMKNGFKILKKIPEIKHSKEVAELMGILMGDGHLGKYQVTMTTNLETDSEHAVFVRDLLKFVFKIEPSINKRKNKKALVVCLSSKEACLSLEKLGMPMGNKITKRMHVPLWIKNNTEYSKAFIRGVYDTDSCFYIDHHLRKGKEYTYAGWTITSYADIFLADISAIMRSLGFPVSNTGSQKSLYLRKQPEIHRYFKEIRTSNTKHKRRYLSFLRN